MAGKSDFTAQEWEDLRKGATGAGLMVSVSDRSFFDTFKEAGVLGKHLAQAKHDNSSEFIRELADTHGTGFGLATSPDKVERETMEALQTARTTLASKAPDELDSYRQFVVDVTRSVAQAADGGESAESETIEKVSAALK